MRPSLSRIVLGCLLVGVLTLAQDAAPDVALLKENNLPVDGAGLLTFFKDRTANKNDAATIQKLITQLGADDFEAREEASRRLIGLGSRALKPLQQATRASDPEVVRRAEDCIKEIKQGTTALVLQAGIRQLTRANEPQTVGVLLAYLPTSEEEGVTDEVRESLARIAARPGKADAALVQGLQDSNPLIRGAAGAALARGKVGEHLPAVRKLLEDGNANVRARVALALASIREKAAVPAMIGVLDAAALGPVELSLVEDLLYRLGEERSPLAPADNTPAARKQFRTAWETWWKDQGEKLDLARLEEATRLMGHTLVVLLDQNKVIDLDATNKPRFTLENVLFPLDVQYLPGDRVLLAEHSGQRVTERDKEGKVLWEKVIDSPLVAQRLPSGNTLIGTRQQLIEVDPKGKEVSTYTRPGGEIIMRAQRLRDGRTAMVTQLGVTRFVMLDREMREIRSFGVDVRTSGGRIEILPNGNVLVPENGNNRVVEHDQNGRIVWELEVDQPIAAWRLPNGNTMVTSMNISIGAVELDRSGKTVWQYKATDRVTRALRR